MRDVLSLIGQKTPITAIAAKLFGSSRVLLDFYLSWLGSQFLAHQSDDPEQWVISHEAQAILLMLRQAPGADAPGAAADGPEKNPAEPRRRRRVMMGDAGAAAPT
jgi:hypothetical protein